MPQAVSPFQLVSFEPPLPDAEDEGVVDGLVQISQAFTGDLAAHSGWSCSRCEPGTA